MALRSVDFGTVCANKFLDAEFTDLTCTVLEVKVARSKSKTGDEKEPEYTTKLTPTNPEFATQIMEYIQAHKRNSRCQMEWQNYWTLPHKHK